MKPYLPAIPRIFNRNGKPEELPLLAIIRHHNHTFKPSDQRQIYQAFCGLYLMPVLPSQDGSPRFHVPRHPVIHHHRRATGELQYFEFIKRIFSGTPHPNSRDKGEIYQYVGDEISEFTL